MEVLDLKHPITSNSLLDACCWIKEGAYLILHNGKRYFRCFHQNCSANCLNETQNTSVFSSLRVIFLDVASRPGLLDKGEWDWYLINEAKADECTCFLKKELCQDAICSILNYAVELRLH